MENALIRRLTRRDPNILQQNSVEGAKLMIGKISQIYVSSVADITFFQNMCIYFLIESNS